MIRPPAALLSLLTLATACLEEAVVECGDGRMCAAQMACDPVHHGCVLPEQLEVCAGAADETPCHYRGVPLGACYDQVCLPAGCGNGIRDTGEVCDDGNRFHGDGCSADCRSDETCGNGKTDTSVGEACDMGPQGNEWCRPDCTAMSCGDGKVDSSSFERCDEGEHNSSAPDAPCRPNCQPRRCGDGVVDQGEVCDDGNTTSADGCAGDCASNERCGNGTIDLAVGETCEPDGQNTAWCRANCVTVRCGDGVVDVEVDELCDEGALNSYASDARCRPNCLPRRCGDGVADSDEVCDDGNRENGDGCSYDCRSRETCGNGYADLGEGEQCDDGNFLSHDGCSSRCRSESLTVRPILSASHDNPYGGAAYDAARDTLVWFGGDTYEQQGSTWTRLNPARVPPARYRPGLVWDAARRRTVLFGRYYAGPVQQSVTWEWDGRDWEPRAPAHSPPPREGFALAYDAAHARVVLFGGRDGARALADTWLWDGHDWRELQTSQAPSPGAHSAAFDARAGHVVVFDGSALWSLEGATWSAVPAPLPILERDLGEPGSLAFDPARGLVYLSTGLEGDTQHRLFVWSGTAWQPLAGPERTALIDARLHYRAAQRRLLLRETGTRLWELDGDTWTQRLKPAATPETVIDPMIYDPLRGSLLLLRSYSADTWTWDGFSWTKAPSGMPEGRSEHELAYDENAGEVVLFGGCCKAGADAWDETWIWNGAAWSQATPATSPPGRSGHAMTYDAVRKRVVLFAGGNDRPSHNLSWNDMWTWDGHTWTQEPLTEAPPPRLRHALSYDPVRRAAVMFGGMAPWFAGVLDDTKTWTWDGAAWHLTSLPTLGLRANHVMLYDANRQATMMLGGNGSDGAFGYTWSSLAPPDGADVWQPIPAPADPAPDVMGISAAYESVRARTVMLAWPRGQGGTTTPIQTWEFSYRAPGELDEVCQHGGDVDGDGLSGCVDPDCWGFCTPLCPPGAACAAELSHCGDGTCNAALETCRLCPADCACEPACGDFFCDPGESAESCPGDCHP